MLRLARERAAWKTGRLLVGVDEAGRGPLAGPVVAAAVLFPADVKRLTGIRDSKTLSEAQRDRAAVLIRKKALGIGVGAASVHEIDRINIRRATALAMRRALDRLFRLVPSESLSILVDGLPLLEIGLVHEALVDGDAICPSIAAAGIIAKTVRDRLMTSLAVRYHHYHWGTNMGYGTLAHMNALAEFGATPHHRRSFMPVTQLRLGL